MIRSITLNESINFIQIYNACDNIFGDHNDRLIFPRLTATYSLCVNLNIFLLLLIIVNEPFGLILSVAT